MKKHESRLSHQARLSLSAPRSRNALTLSLWAILGSLGCMLGSLGCGSAPHSRASEEVSSQAPSAETSPDRSSPLQVDQRSSRLSPKLPLCREAQVALYQQTSSQLTLYVERFIKEISRFNRINNVNQSLNMTLRRSEVMIAFGDDLLQRMRMIELISQCASLRPKYLRDRAALFNKLEVLIKSQSESAE